MQMRGARLLHEIQKRLVTALFRVDRRFVWSFAIALRSVLYRRHALPSPRSAEIERARVRDHKFLRRAMAFFKVWRLLKNSAHGSLALRRRRKFPRLNVDGSSEGLTSDQSSGVETGACGLRRTE